MNTLLPGLLLGWLTLALALWLVRLGRRWWYVRRYGPPIDHSALLVEYGRRMTGALSSSALRELLVRDIPPRLQSAQAALLLPDGYELVSGAETRLRLSLSHGAVRWVASGGSAQRVDKGRLRELVPLDAALGWTRVWTPLMRGVELRGLWLLGERAEGHAYAPADLDWLTALGRQAAIVLEALHYAEQEQRAASELRALYQQVVSAQEMERGRLAREIHDGALQDLCAVTRDLKALAAQSLALPGSYTDLPDRAGQVVQELRAICNDLRPPLLQRDLAAALRALVAALDARSPAPVHLEVSATDLRLSDEAALAVYRITQEAIHNAIQHADASEIAVRLTQYPDQLRLTITDDGRGLQDARGVAGGHLGLAGMRERAAMIGARLDIQTAVDYGTVVILELPL